MKKIIMGVAAAALLFSCKTQNVTQPNVEKPVVARINLVDVQDDKVWVSVDPDRFTVASTTFNIPKTVPGTYSEDNYGKFTEGFKALDYKGKELPVTKIDENSYSIPNAKDLDKVMYLVNDSFDWDNEGGVYSMAGTNILKDENFLLNLHGFVGYFDQMKEKKFRLEILRPEDLIAGTSLTIDSTVAGDTPNSKMDIYNLDRYFEVIDNPIMYSAPDTTSFMVENMKVLLSVYSPNKKHSAQSLRPEMEKMIRAQKRFLGDINSTDKYAILVYLSDSPGEGNAGNFGALEHHTSTVVVMPETMEAKALDKSMTDIVSHEFFHIITPLGIHSNEVHYFDYNDPKMSQHLWLYEGVTEYFANLFQVNQDLIDDQEFYNRMVEKINSSRRFDDTVPFTLMSKNILKDEYKDSYYNVYLKGALIGMALDIRLRELSNGKMGILDLMKKLNDKYGKDKPFEDENLIPVIVELTYPEIQNFFDTYVTGTTPIPYDEFFAKVGLEEKEIMKEVGYFINGQIPYITANQQTMEIVFRSDIEMNTFLKDLGIQGGETLKSVNGTTYNIQNVYDLIMASQSWEEGDEITMTYVSNGEEMKKDLGIQGGETLKSVNGTTYNIQNVYDLIMASQSWEEGDEITMTYVSNGEEMKVEGKISIPKAMNMTYAEVENADSEQIELRNAWIKG